MTQNDKLILDISDDTEMKDYLGTKGAGDECNFTLTVSLDEQTDDQAVFSVRKITVNSYREAPASEEGAEELQGGEGAMPVMMIMAKAKPKGDAKSY